MRMTSQYYAKFLRETSKHPECPTCRRHFLGSTQSKNLNPNNLRRHILAKHGLPKSWLERLTSFLHIGG